MAKRKNDAILAELDAAAAGGEAPSPELEDLLGEASSEDQIAKLTAERDEMRERFIRALADAENMRKRSERDRREAEKFGGSRLARDLLPVFDSLTRALDHATEEQKAEHGAFITGVELTLRELLNVFSKHGIEQITPEQGEKFDPRHHQAMFEAPLPETRAGDIIEVMATGFLLHDRLLRPAQVGVSSNREESREESGSSAA